MKKPPIYLFSPTLTYKTFYKIWNKFPNGDLVPTMFIKAKPIWEMVRDKQMYLYLDPLEKDDPVIFALKLPKRDILLLDNPIVKKLYEKI